MPRLVSDRQKAKIRFLYRQGSGPFDIRDALAEEFGEGTAASIPTIAREIRKLREEEYRWRSDEILITQDGEQSIGSKASKRGAIPWSVGNRDFNNEETALVSRVVDEALKYDPNIPSRTTIAQARWILRFGKSFPALTGIILWHAGYEAEFVEALKMDPRSSVRDETGFLPIDRALRFCPWRVPCSERAQRCLLERVVPQSLSHIGLGRLVRDSTPAVDSLISSLTAVLMMGSDLVPEQCYGILYRED